MMNEKLEIDNWQIDSIASFSLRYLDPPCYDNSEYSHQDLFSSGAD